MSVAPTEADLLLNQIVNSADLSGLSPASRVAYYKEACESVGLNPYAKPFEFISLSGKVVLYAKRECTDQLRKLHNINIKIVDRTVLEGTYIVTARATMTNGREDESTGAVSLKFPKTYKNKKGEIINHPKAGQDIDGEDKANALMKAETKAKRRVTLSIVGLGILDESEISDIANASQDPEDVARPRVDGPVAKTNETLPAQPAASTTAAAADTKPSPPNASEATAPASSVLPAAAAPTEPVKTEPAKPEAAPAAPAAAGETGEIMPAARLKTFEAKLKAANIDDAAFQAKFGKPLSHMLKSQSAEIQAFIAGK